MNHNQSGIYAIVNRINGKEYRGSAASSFRQRWNEHLSDLSRGVHPNKHLQAAWNKYGPQAFDFVILEVVSGRAALIAAEQRWIDDALDRGIPLYNKSPTAGSQLGYKQPPDVNARIRAIRKEQWKKPGVKERLSQTLRRVLPGVQAKRKATLETLWNDPERRQQMQGQFNQTFHFISPDGTPYTTINLSAFCREHGLDVSAMAKVHRGVRPVHKGWRKA